LPTGASATTSAPKKAEEVEAIQSRRWREEDESPIANTAQAAVANPVAQPRVWANDNKTNDNKLPAKPLVPDSDVQRFYRERVVGASEASSLTSTELYEEYCAWCEENEKVPFAHPRVTREIGELGVRKERIGKRTRYFGIALKSAGAETTDDKLPEALARAA